jgi:hypothetical protein
MTEARFSAHVHNGFGSTETPANLLYDFYSAFKLASVKQPPYLETTIKRKLFL